MKVELTAAWLALGLALAPVAGHAADKEQSKSLDQARAFLADATISSKVKAEFAKDTSVSATNIRVDTAQGVVRLSGTAKSKAEADKAEAIAKATAGVTSVQNEIKVGGR